LLATRGNVITAMKFGGAGTAGVRPIAIHDGTDRVGFTDILLDPGGIVRRGLLFLDDGGLVHLSLDLRLALIYLAGEGIVPKPDSAQPEHLRIGRTTLVPLGGSEGAYVGADAGGYQYLLDYRERPGAFPAVTLHDVLDGEFDPRLFEDRIVIVGVTADSVKDVFFTPFSAGFDDARHTPGIELHAHILSQLLRMGLDGTPATRTLSGAQEGAWTLLWTVLGGLLALAVRSAPRFALLGMLGFGLIAALATWAFLHDLWIPLVPPSLGWALAAPLVAAYVSSRENAERKSLMSLFSKHVSPQLAGSIWENRERFLGGDRPRPQRLTATVFFSDIVGFTTISEKLEPQMLMDWLDAYMQAMTPLVNRHGGVILRFIGDAIMAVFGIPVPRQTDEEIREDAIRAVDCALSMRDALIEHNRSLAERRQPLVAMRIGILTGPMVAGTLGSAERLEYNVHGDTVNTAARLESFEKETYAPDRLRDPCRILIGKGTASLVSQRFELQAVGEVGLKGKAETVAVYRVLGHRDPQPAQAPAC
jgi:adenylate cyclase